MSSIKDEFLDAGLDITFTCPSCGDVIEAEVQDTCFDWTNDSPSDGISSVITDIGCPHCEREYGVEVVAKPGEKEVNVLRHPHIEVRFRDNTFDGDDYDAFLAESTPEDAYEVYRQSMAEIDGIDTSAPMSIDARRAMLKMLFLQYVVILEAYLSDKLINIITDNNNKLKALIGSVESLRDFTPKLIDIAKDPDFVQKTAVAYLQRFSFHRLTDVAKFYHAVLKINIYGEDRNVTEMGDIIQKRHHLVHRNGRDNEGKMIEIKLLDVSRVRKLVSEMVERIQSAQSTRMPPSKPWGRGEW